ncbi:Predicted arabinose efflux permease, MFS family [Glycomyces sambucus]|uniref:Predicted arabinose efflux permease, MFS family n=1 Tax=Glycomyces sambucus TaxID=380244 RepID=A0A1G9G0A6_9ACTN|nr:Predicted arabinose efflux permease, MFS family [Glycomyces sambucus]
MLAIPGMAALMSASLLARTAITANTTALVMFVVLALDLSYAAAGAVAAALTAGIAVSGPLLGRLIDRRGLRTVLLGTVTAQVLFWTSVPFMDYGVLLPTALAAGLLMVPVQSVTRQAIAAMTTPEQRRAAFALEAVQGELTYLIGPAVVILLAASTSPGPVAWGVGAAIVAGGALIGLLNPPLRTADEAEAHAGPRPPRRAWLDSRMIAVLTMAVGTTTLLGGIDLAIIAALEATGQVSRAAAVVAVLGITSVIGGLVYGAMTRPMPTWLLLALLGLATMPLGLAPDWRWLCLAAVVAGLLTAPTLATVADAVSMLAPASVRGEATGLQASAQSAGIALGAPLAGLAIDLTVPAGGFAAAGLAGVVAALVGLLLSRNRIGRTPSGARPAAGA